MHGAARPCSHAQVLIPRRTRQVCRAAVCHDVRGSTTTTGSVTVARVRDLLHVAAERPSRGVVPARAARRAAKLSR